MPERPHTNYQILKTYLGPRWPVLLLLAAGLAGAAGLQVSMPRLLGAFIDSALAGADAGYLAGLAATYLALAYGNHLISLGAGYLGQDLSWKSTNALRDDLFAHCLHLGLDFHNRRTPGELIQRIDGDVGSMSNFLSQFSVRILGNLLLAAGVLAQLFREDWRIGLGLSGFVLIALYVMLATRGMAVPARKEMNETLAQVLGFIEERLGCLADLRPNGAAGYVMQGLYLLSRRRHRTTQTSFVMSSARWAICMSAFLTGYLFALSAGAWLLFAGKITVGTVYTIYAYTGWRGYRSSSAFSRSRAGRVPPAQVFRARGRPGFPRGRCLSRCRT